MLRDQCYLFPEGLDSFLKMIAHAQGTIWLYTCRLAWWIWCPSRSALASPSWSGHSSPMTCEATEAHQYRLRSPLGLRDDPQLHCCVGLSEHGLTYLLSLTPDLPRIRVIMVAVASVITCAVFGFVAAVLSGVKIAVGTLRVLIIGIITLGVTYAVGYGFSQLPGV